MTFSLRHLVAMRCMNSRHGDPLRKRPRIAHHYKTWRALEVEGALARAQRPGLEHKVVVNKEQGSKSPGLLVGKLGKLFPRLGPGPETKIGEIVL